MDSVTSIIGDTTPPKQRVQIVDALRGLALLGMLLVHFQYYVKDDGVWSLRVDNAIDVLAVDRFYPLFAFLFGVGFALQFTRWGDRVGFLKIYLRRLVGLMIIAALLIAFTGYHVLETYAVWGLALLFVRKWSNRALLVLLLLCAFSRPIIQLAVWQWERTHITLEQSNAKVQAEWSIYRNFNREADRLRNEGTFTQLMSHRLRFNFGRLLNWHFYTPEDPFAMMLLGMLAVRLRILQEPARYRRLLTFIAIFGLIAGVASVVIWLSLRLDASHLRLLNVRRGLIFAIFDERFQGLAYGAILLLATAKAVTTPAVVRVLAAPGRLSLTNYVAQVVILETLFASNTPIIRPNRWTSLLGVAIIFGAQVIFSCWWISRFRVGPLEWLWRSITFARWEPLRRDASLAVAAP